MRGGEERGLFLCAVMERDILGTHGSLYEYRQANMSLYFNHSGRCEAVFSCDLNCIFLIT